MNKGFIRTFMGIDTRPTKYFLYLVLAIVGLFFLAYMHNYNIVYIMMFFIFSLAGASSVLGRLNLYKIQAKVLNSQNIFANTSSTYTLSLYNPSEDKDAFALECKNDFSEVFLSQLNAYETKPIELNFIPTKRGKMTLPIFQVGSHFPLPHEILFKKIDLNHECIVYPEAKGDSLDAFTSKNRAFVGEYDDFEGIKSFVEGESLSLIYWPSIAKGGDLMSKDFSTLEQTKHLHFYFKDAGKETEVRLSALCLWALQSDKKNIPYSIHLPLITLKSTSRSLHEILEFLALY